MTQVKLLQHTPDPDLFCAKLARTAWDEGLYESVKIKKDKPTTREDWMKFLRKIISVGHTSTIEHAVFTFELSGISRVLTHQLVRHRIASYTQKSHRHLKAKRVIIPPSVQKRIKAFRKDIDASFDLYDRMIEKGIPMEDARYFSPSGSETAIEITMNARSLFNFFNLRCSKHAQWEIRAVAIAMLEMCYEIAPVMFEDLYEKFCE